MKYSELDFKGGIVTFDSYKNYPEAEYFTDSTLSQDMLMINYGNYTIDLGWYGLKYMIAIINNNCEEWIPFYSIKVLSHEEVFDKLQEVINLAPKYYKLMVFS